MKSKTRARDQQVSGPTSAHNYPAKITLSPGAERYLEQLGQDLVTGDVNLEQLPPSLLQLYVIAFDQGRASLTPTLERAERDADRLYFEATIRQPKPQGEYTSWADLQRRRAERETEAAGTYPGGDILAAWDITPAP